MRKLFLLLMGVMLFAVQVLAQRTVTGTVTDDKGIPLSKVSVQVKGSTTGTLTKDDGTYSLVLPANASTLVFSSVDLATQEVRITSSSSYSVSLASADKSMEEVVVIAYGTAKKESLTGSVGQIKTEQIAKRPIGNITGAIEGNVPGVITTSANGQPGAGIAIRVRGFGSINATSEPLFVVDGVPYIGGTSNINPDDVESITVLKDAASTALYGSRAANGVVVITTKKGKKGRNAISVRALHGFVSRGLQEYERVNAFQYYPLLWEAYRNSLVYPFTGAAISLDSANKVASGLTTRTGIKDLLSYNPFNIPNNAIVGVNGQLNPAAQLLYPDDLDWTKDLMRNGNRKDYTINFNGGADKVDYFISAGYLKEEGYTLKTDFERYTTRINVNVQPKDWLKTGFNLSGNYSVSTTAADGGSTSFVNPFFFSRNVGPIYPVFAHNMTNGAYVLDAKGNRIWDLGNFGTSALGIANGIPNRPGGGFAGRHALAETTLNIPFFKRTVVSARNYTDITFLKKFKFTNNVSVDFQNQNNSSYENTLVGDGAPGGRSQKQALSSTGFIASQLVNYGNKFNSHKVDALIGHESFNQHETDVNGFKQGQTLTGNTELGNFTTINGVGSSIDKYRIESYFSRVNYDFNNKYLLSASIRRDGNSRFASESRWGTFWSVGAGWNMHKEKFMDGFKWVNALKLRSSYGVVGVADGIGFYAYQGLYVFANNANEPGIAQSQTSVLNRKLTWEENKQFDLGLDFILFKNRISGSLEYYNRVSKDLLFAVPLPLSSGLLSYTQNTATMFNKGVEAQVSADIFKTKNFTWNTTINVSTVNNEITRMPESVKEFVTGTKKYKVGQSIFDYWLRTFYGVDPLDGAALYVANDKTITANRRIITVKNGGLDTFTTNIANGKFEYHEGTIPDFYGSLSQSFSYKQFTLSALFSFQKGGKTYDGLYQALMSAGNYGGALHPDILNRWQKPGDVTNVPRMDAGAQRATDHNATSSRWLTDASFFNIRTVSLSYDLPQSLISRFRVTNAQFFLSAENVAFFSKRRGMNNQQAFSGVTSNAYPPARIVTIGLSLNL
ncbi:MAG: SusC/RagA family TonB-linked outer membrane protein [Ferruginibacter sp.]|nr:SusC/RagA family TonB-linked outer membrane protein [Chitinophagaceae bacterium]